MLGFLLLAYLFYLVPLVATIEVRFFIACFLQGRKKSKLFAHRLEYGLLILPFICWLFSIGFRSKSLSNGAIEPFFSGLAVGVVFILGLLFRKYSSSVSTKVVAIVELGLSCLLAISIALLIPLLPE
jgi:hypothetical protein